MSLHPNDRCTTVPYYEDDEDDTRFARDENGKRIEIENEEYVSPDILVEIKDFQKLLHTVDNIPFEIKAKTSCIDRLCNHGPCG